jgi:hypothetical protein
MSVPADTFALWELQRSNLVRARVIAEERSRDRVRAARIRLEKALRALELAPELGEPENDS